MDVPEGIAVNVLKNNDLALHITMLAAPDDYGELSDDELENAARSLVTNVYPGMYPEGLC